MGLPRSVSYGIINLVAISSFLTLLPLAGRSMAGQVGTGSIIGQVTDESGAILPGVTVTASSAALQVQHVTAVTEGAGKHLQLAQHQYRHGNDDPVGTQLRTRELDLPPADR